MRKLGILFICLCSLAGLLGAASPSQPALAAEDDGNFVVQTIPGPTVAERVVDRTQTSWPWYLSRASGLIAAITLIILMLSGIGQITGYTFKFLDPLTSWASHRALGIACGVAVLVHVFSLLFDKFIKFNLLELLVPWLSKYQPVTLFGWHVGSLYIALGVLSLYLIVIIIFTSLVWVEKKPYLWKLIHLLSYMLIFFIFIHALYLGTDLTHGVLRWLWIAAGLGILVASLQRLWRAKTT